MADWGARVGSVGARVVVGLQLLYDKRIASKSVADFPCRLWRLSQVDKRNDGRRRPVAQGLAKVGVLCAPVYG